MVRRRRSALAAFLATGLLALSACGGGDGPTSDRSATQPAESPASASPTEEAAASGHDGHYAEPARSRRLRAGETRTTIAMPGSYTPSAPYGTGTDDYRCFLLDPELERDTWLTGTQVLPGNPEVVHHVILFQVPPEQEVEREGYVELIEAEPPGELTPCTGVRLGSTQPCDNWERRRRGW